MIKKIILFLFLSHYCLANEIPKCFSKEKSHNYYFINGILNSPEEANRSSVQLKTLLKLKTKISLLYNENTGFFEDIKETFTLMKINDKDNIYGNFDEKINKSYNSFYTKLSKDKINIIIAHSEGNLFAENLCINNTENKIIENISIAPPLSVLKCNSLKTYVLYDNDKVISQIEKINKKFFHFDPTHKGEGFLSHSLESYLSNSLVVKDLKKGIEKTLQHSYEQNFSFFLANIEIIEDNKFKSLLNNVEDIKDSVALWGREKQAFLNVISYAGSITSKINQKGFAQKILNTEIPAETEQDFADMIAYTLNSLNSYCKSVFPQKLQPLCKDVGVLNYFKSKELIESLLIYDNMRDWKFSVPCNVASTNIDKSLSISVRFQKRFPIIEYNQKELEFNYEVKNDKITELKIGNINILKNKDDEIISTFEQNNIQNSSNTDFKNQLTSCNTLNKLSSNNCQKFLKHIKDIYFAQGTK